MPGGRPSDYRPEFCNTVIECGKLGKSVAQMALACGVSKKTLLEWANVHEEFRNAFTQAKLHSQDWWETVAQTHMIEEPGAAKLNHGIWSRSMAARFPDDYTEKRQQELSGPNGAPLLTGLQVELVKPKNDDGKDSAS